MNNFSNIKETTVLTLNFFKLVFNGKQFIVQEPYLKFYILTIGISKMFFIANQVMLNY
jgi:hypothetical protein